MFFPASAWFAAFALTVTVEIVVAVAFLRPAGSDLARVAALVLFANLATHPIVWYVLTQPFLPGTPEYLVVAESWAFATEALFYAITIAGLSRRRAAGLSLAANLASILAGLAVNAIAPGLLM